MKYTYLASPYTHPDPEIRTLRFKEASRAAARLMAEGEVVFCPIAHSHPIDIEFPAPQSGEFWKKQDAPFLAGASKMKVLMIPGWRESPGVTAEIQFATDNGIPVEYIK